MKNKKTILLTGSHGYIGSMFYKMYCDNYNFQCLDTNFYGNFSDNLKSEDSFLKKDIRDISSKDFTEIDYVVHMAELSNDPLGELNPGLTEKINIDGTQKLAQISEELGVEKFIYMSSCSVYGQSENNNDEEAKTSPLTSYAKAKVHNEEYLLNSDYNFEIKILRNATAFGFSPNTRLDLVINDLTYSAIKTKKLELLSDGTPKRPFVHIYDICKVINESLTNNNNPRLLINVGTDNLNYSIKEVATQIGSSTDVSNISYGVVDSDQRSYFVDFKKLKKVFPEFEFRYDLQTGILDLIKNFTTFEETTNSRRVKKINHLLANGEIDENFEWK